MTLNEGLELLGTDEHVEIDPQFEETYVYPYEGVFFNSKLKTISLPSTLKRIEYGAFKKCAGLASISLPEGLEEIGMGSFEKSGIEHVAIPKSLVVIEKWAFHKC